MYPPSVFELYIEAIMASSLIEGQLVIMDNLAVHMSAKVEQLSEAHGCHLHFLSGYSPDFSPIEETFAKVKAYLRRVEACTREALQEALCQAVLTVTAHDAQGWFRHRRYVPRSSAISPSNRRR
jgi:transposase